MNMQEGKTNKKTIIFQSAEIKNFCDVLIQAKSKKTGISMMRLIENALIKEFGFNNDSLNEWCCEYGKDSTTTSYMELLELLSEKSSIYNFYKTICTYANIPLRNDVIEKHISALPDVNASDVNVSDDKIVERMFMMHEPDDINKIMCDFIYTNSSLLDSKPIPLDNVVALLINADKNNMDRKDDK